MSTAIQKPDKPREWWIIQTLLSYTIGEPVYRATDNKPTSIDYRTSAAIYNVVEKSAYEISEVHNNAMAAEIIKLRDLLSRINDCSTMGPELREELNNVLSR